MESFRDRWNKFVVYFVNLQPVDLLPFRIEDARRQLELEGDFSFEALTLLREAEEERSSSIEIGVGFKEFASVSNEGYGHHSRGVGSQIQKQIPHVPVAAHLHEHSSNCDCKSECLNSL